MYVSGQLGLDPATQTLVNGGVLQETEQTLKNLQAVLQGAGVDMGHIVKMTILLADIGDWAQVDSVYQRYFTSRHPARAAYAVAGLPKGARVEMEAVAVIGKIDDVQ